MPTKLECPICETVFLVENPVAAGKVTCPSCQRTFRTTSKKKTAQKDSPPPKPTKEDANTQPNPISTNIPIAQSIASDSPNNAIPMAVPTLRPSPAAQVTINKKKVSGDDAGAKAGVKPAKVKKAKTTPGIQTAKYQKRKKKDRATTIVILAGLTLLVLALGGFVYKYQADKKSRIAKASTLNESLSGDADSTTHAEGSGRPSADFENQPVEKRVAKVTDTNQTIQNESGTESEEPASPVAQPPRDLPAQEVFFFNQKQIRDCWALVQPRLVSLEIEGPNGTSQAVGTVIDSRGWVLTSLQAIEGAWKIHVTASSKSIQEADEANPLQDLVQGIVASDPANDQVLLAVNRRFVVSFGDAQITDNTRIVRGEYLLQCGPPTDDNPYGHTEVRVVQRGGYKKLPASVQSRAESLHISPSGQPWYTINGATPAIPGMPLFKIDGTLAATVAFNEQDNGFALPANQLAKLIRSADGKLASLATPPATAMVEEEVLSLYSDQPGEQLNNRLTKARLNCEPFQFLPNNEQEYQSLQEFLQLAGEGKRFVEKNEDAHGADEIQKQLEQFQISLSRNFQSILKETPQRITKLNSLAKTRITKGDAQLVFFGSLYVGGVSSTKLILKFDKLDTYASVEFDPDAPPMRPYTNWLFVVTTPSEPDVSRLTFDRIGTLSVHATELNMAIGPIDK